MAVIIESAGSVDLDKLDKNNEKYEKQLTEPKINFQNINNSINEFFVKKNTPVFIDEIKQIKQFADLLYPYYFGQEESTDYKYSFSIVKNIANDYNLDSIYILDVTIYCNARLMLHIKFDGFEYTQYQIGNQIFQIYQSNEYFKIFNLKHNKYELIKDKSNDFNKLLQRGINLVFGEDNNITLASQLENDVNILLYPIKKMIDIHSFNYTINIKTINNDIKIYNIQLFNKYSFEVSSSDRISDVLNSFTRHNNLLKSVLLPDFDLNYYFDIETHYFKMQYHDQNKSISRKQIYYGKTKIFDGKLIVAKSSQMLFTQDANNELSINELTPYNSKDNISIIYINEVAKYRDCLNFSLPLFFDNDDYLTKEFIGKKNNNFTVTKIIKNDNTYYGISYKYRDNKLICETTRNLKTNDFKQKVYNFDNNEMISQYEKIHENTNGTITHKINVVFDNIKIIYIKHQYISGVTISCNKQVFSNNNIVFDGTINNNIMDVKLNIMSDRDKSLTRFNELLSYNFITIFGINLDYADVNDNIGYIETEEIKSHDNKYIFEFRYKYDNLITTYGNTFNKATNIIVSQTENKDKNIKSIDQHNYNNDGQQKNSKFIDEANKLVVKALTQEEIKAGRFGYKAGKTIDNKLCIIKLFIPKDAKVAWDAQKDKYRTDKVIVLSIQKVYYNKKQHYYTKDLLEEDCPICMDCIATHIAYPCRHKICGKCWKLLLEKCENKNCHYCKSLIDKVEEISINKIENQVHLDKEETYAYSCIHTDKFEYIKDDEITIKDFDPNLNKVCSNGIHFHSEEKDVFQWFEYLNIPDEVLHNSLPNIIRESSEL